MDPDNISEHGSLSPVEIPLDPHATSTSPSTSRTLSMLTAPESIESNRAIPTSPESVLTVPCMVDDFYTQLISWSCRNIIAACHVKGIDLFARGSLQTEAVRLRGADPDNPFYDLRSIEFSGGGDVLGVGTHGGDVELWDIETRSKLRTMRYPSTIPSDIPCLSWNRHIVSCGWEDGGIRHYDVRMAKAQVLELSGHQQTVCGLKWRDDGQFLASGCNEGILKVWDIRAGDVKPGSSRVALWTNREYGAAAKALAWCPWQPSLLASGGGARDPTLKVWETTTGTCLHSQETPGQVASVQWSPHHREILTTHGNSCNGIGIYTYSPQRPLDEIIRIRQAHSDRVLWSAVGPGGEVVCTGAADRKLKLWKIWGL